MYAVIKTGGKQYRAAVGDVLKVEKIGVEQGQLFELNQVLLIADDDKLQVGDPFIKGAKVMVEVLEHDRGQKINIIKFKRRKHHMKHMGHRQWFTKVKITSIDS